MRHKTLRILLVSNSVFMLAIGLLGPLYAVFVQKFSSAVMTISISWAVFILSSTLFVFILSRVGDRLDKKYLLLGGFLVRSLAWILLIFVSSLSQLIFLQVLLGLGEALGTPAFEALFAEHLDQGKHIRNYSDMWVANNVVAGVGTLIGGVVVSYLGFPILFILMSSLAIFSFFILLTKLRDY